MTDAAFFLTLQGLLDNLPGAAFRSRRNYPYFTIEYISEGCRQMFGCAPEEIMGKGGISMPEVIHPEDLSDFCEKIHSTIMLPHPSGKPFEHTFRVLCPDGSVRWVWEKCSVTEYNEDNPDDSIVEGVFLDVTEKMAERNSELMGLVRHGFIEKLSRDIRTPVSSITGLGALLLETPLDILQQNYVENILESADNLLGVLSEITGISLIESDNVILREHDFSPRELMDELADIFTSKAERKGLTLNLEVDASVPDSVSGDSVCLKEILLNLIDTAIKNTLDGTITVACTVDTKMPTYEEEIALMFKMYGDGVPQLDSDDPDSEYSDIENIEAAPYGERGIGLSVSKKLVRLMHGETGVGNFAETGTTYYFSAPFSPPSSQIPDIDLENEKIRPLRILLVEDTPINQLVANDILVKMGHEVEVAENGMDALEVMQLFDFDVVFMDCEMPIIDGYETTRLIRNKETGVKNPYIPVIALTANAMIGDRQKCMDAGMDDYITKPMSAERIRRTLLKWSQPSRQRSREYGA